MKKFAGTILFILLIMICTFALADVEINETTFPDSAFRDFVKEKYDLNKDNALSADEISKCVRMDASHKGIADLKGIEHFSSLNDLRCNGNKLTSLNLSSNTELEVLDCCYNALTSLDLGNNRKLKELICYYNTIASMKLPDSLTSLDCYNNKLTSLDLSNFTSLEFLAFGDNKLSSVNLSGCTRLKEIKCNYSNLHSLDVSDLSALRTLNCGENLIESLDLRNNANLESVDCVNNKLKSLQVAGLKNLRFLACYGNSLSDLDITGCKQLNYLIQNGTHNEWTTCYTYGAFYLETDRFVSLKTDSRTIPAPEKAKKIKSVKIINTKTELTRTMDHEEPTLRLDCSIDPDHAINDLEWSSSNEKVATVDEYGIVTAHKKGKATITCKSKGDQKVKSSCKITVKDKQIKSIKLNKNKVTIKKKETFQLEVKKVKPSDAVSRKFKWSSSDEKIATVDKNGKVKAKKKGECIITCEAKDGGGAKAEVKIKVK